MSYTLLLIDLQLKFEEPDPDFLDEITGLVLDAIEAGASIGLVEFRGFGSTWAEVRQLVEGYENCFKFRKKGQDGGSHVVRRMRHLKVPHTDKILVGGLYTEWCVKSTVTTMAEMMPESQFRIKRKACLPYYGKKKAWQSFRSHSKTLKNIKFA